MEIKEILEKALAFYDDHDWIQGQSFSHSYFSPREGMLVKGACLEGACRVVVQPFCTLGLSVAPEVMDAWSVLSAAAFELFPERFPFGRPAAVHKFNDHELTTREDALLVLKFAIEKAEDGSHDRAESAG